MVAMSEKMAETPADGFDDASALGLSLPTEDDLPCDNKEPMETPRNREQMKTDSG